MVKNANIKIPLKKQRKVILQVKLEGLTKCLERKIKKLNS